MSTPPRAPSKKDVARSLLLRGSCFVHLDPRRDDVSVPDWLRKQPQLVLQVGFDMPIPIPDLRVDDAGVFGTLSFSRSPFPCTIPWQAVFALVGDDGKGMVWPEDIPEEIAEEVERETRRQRPVLARVSADTTKASEPRPKKPSAPAAVQTTTRVPQPEAAPAPSSGANSRKRTRPREVVAKPRPKAKSSRKLPPYLRIVK